MFISRRKKKSLKHLGQSSSLTVLSPCLLIGPDPSAQGGKVTLSWLRKIKQTRQRDGLSYK